MPTFITRLQDIKITEALYKGVELSNGLYLANDRARVKRLVSDEFVTWTGQLEAGYLLKCDAYLYAVTKDTAPMGGEIGTINSFLGMGQLALTSLWLVKDNAVNLDTGFLITDPRQPGGGVSSNVWSVRNSNASRTRQVSVFSREELKQAATFFSTWASGHGHDEADNPLDIFRNAARLDRVFFFLQAARAQNMLPLKIAHYCTCLEALFTTESEEVSHKVAERVAHFLGSGLADKQEIYDQVKRAYGIRSRVVHGDVLARRTGPVEPEAIACDNLLRRTIRKILQDPALREIFSDEQGRLNAYFKELIFA
jgi:hypothetical protein